MVVHCELYVCDINRLDIPEAVDLNGYLSQQNTVTIYLNCQDSNVRGLNPRPSTSLTLYHWTSLINVWFQITITIVNVIVDAPPKIMKVGIDRDIIMSLQLTPLYTYIINLWTLCIYVYIYRVSHTSKWVACFCIICNVYV